MFEEFLCNVDKKTQKWQGNEPIPYFFISNPKVRGPLLLPCLILWSFFFFFVFSPLLILGEDFLRPIGLLPLARVAFPMIPGMGERRTDSVLLTFLLSLCPNSQLSFYEI